MVRKIKREAQTCARRLQAEIDANRGMPKLCDRALASSGNLAGICGLMLTTLTLPLEAWLLIVSSTRKNFSASMARSHWWLICETYTPATCADTAIELGAIAASRQPPCGWGRFRFSVEGAIQSFPC